MTRKTSIDLLAFSRSLLDWFDVHGRHHLPWQSPITPYRVWISEIMLQQTQVDTVIPYFERFMQRFPRVHDLAAADSDDVMHLWTGLGYYARARNMHKCAKHLVETVDGKLPRTVDALKTLPGIGPSTAAAISSIAFNQSDAIMDGNVKRVLTRYHAIQGWPGTREIGQQLWQLAREHMPKERCRDYTQAIMDLGATVCKRSKPHCDICPMSARCAALAENNVGAYPYKKETKEKPIKHCQMLLINNSKGEIALLKRPSAGIWGGLWSLPELDIDDDPIDYVNHHYGEHHIVEKLNVLKHVFSHYTLMIQPMHIRLASESYKTMENSQSLWYNPHFPQRLGLAAPVKKLLHR